MNYELIVRCCDNATDGGEIMELISAHVGKEIRNAGTCVCSVNAERQAEYASAHDSYLLTNPAE